MTYSAAIEAQLAKEAQETPATKGDDLDAFWQSFNDGSRQVEAPEKPFVPPSERRRKAPAVSLGWRKALEAPLAPWQARLGSRAVDQARAELEEALEAAQFAADAVKSIGADQQAEHEAIAAQARADVASGTRTKVATTDWTYETAAREAAWSAAHDAASKAQRRYRAVVSSEAPKHLERLVADGEKARTSALKKLEAARRDVAEAVAATKAVREADTALGLHPRGWHRGIPSRRELPAKAVAGFDHVMAFLKADGDYETGRYVLDGSTTLPLHTREALMTRGRERDRWIVALTERSEGYAVTAYTRGMHIEGVTDSDAAIFQREHLSCRDIGPE
jgi:hypothetical protein